jgi:signal transduction histidine kinase
VVRNQIASDLHDAVGANLSAINNFIELLIRKQNAKQSDMLARLTAKIKKITVDTISNLQDTVWAINPLNDSIEELLVRMKDFAILMLGTKEIRMIYDNHYDPKKPVKLDMQQRHAMYMMFKEMINNIVKYSNATEVNIQISNDHSGLFIEVKDNGIGFDPNAPQKGNGLRNFRNRAKENFIDLDLKTAPGAGVQTQMMVHSLA